MTSPVPLTTSSVVVAQDLRLVRDGRPVLQGVDLTVAPGETLAVLACDAHDPAPRAVLQILAGLALPDSGWVHWGRQDLVRLSDSARSALRRRDLGVALDVGLLPELPVLENIALPLLLDGRSHRAAVGAAADLLDDIGLSGKGARRVGQLSDVDRVLVTIGRALVAGPALLVVDDPTTQLCPDDAEHVLDILLAACARLGAALVIGTCSPRTADRCSRRIMPGAGRSVRSDLVSAAQALR